MFCSGCGQPIPPQVAFCPQCGRAVAPPPQPVTPLAQAAGADAFAGRLKVLTIVWMVWSVLVLLTAFQGLSFIGIFSNFRFGANELGLMDGPFGPFFGTRFVHLYWMLMLLRGVLIAAAAWGLWQRTGWGRILAIVLAFFSLFHFPFGTAIGIWTLTVLLGRRNAALYTQLRQS